MAFFSRPNLENLQFKQLADSILTLSGLTQIVTVSGLTLSDGAGRNIFITASGASSGTTGYVMTYDHSMGMIRLQEAPSSGITYYMGSTPAAISLGGIVSGTTLTGKTISEILQELLVPTLYPTLTAPSNTFTISPTTLTYEVGCSISITGCTIFNRGCINPQYSSASPYRSGLPVTHNYSNFGVWTEITTTNINNAYSFGAHTITLGGNPVSGGVTYSCGVQPKDSVGNDYCLPLPSGATTPISKTISGILPWYWGLSTGCTISGTCVANCGCGVYGCKCVANVTTAAISIIYNSSSSDYIWFALPACAATKTCWCVNATNNGCIGGTGNLFATYCTVSVISAESCWSGCSYEVYVSCYPSGTAVGVPMYIC